MSDVVQQPDAAAAEYERKRRKSFKRFLPRTLMGRSLMILIAPILIAQVVAFYIFFDLHQNKVTTRMAYAVSGEIAIVARSLDQGTNSGDIKQVMAYAAENLGLQISFAQGASIKKSSWALSDFPFWETNAVRILKGELDNRLNKPMQIHYDEEKKEIQIDIGLRNGVLNVMLPERRFYTSSGYIFLSWMTISSFIMLVIAVIFMRNQIRPIRKLAAAAERFGKGRDAQFFKPEGAWEVRQAGQAFMEMHRRIRRQIEQRTLMLAGVSHDLRTPLTRLKLQMAMMGDSPDVEAMKIDVAEMEKMISGYLDFVSGEAEEAAQMISLSQMIDKVAASARRQGIEIIVAADRDVHAMLKPVAFERCLTNLVGNAGKHAPHVWVSARTFERNIEIAVDDDGPGIPPEQYEEVFRPFYRVDTSRNAATGGVGLGLPIAMDIVHAHGGLIWLEKSPQGGLRVMITLPV